MADEVIRSQPALGTPAYGPTPFVTPPRLSNACVALCTTAALHRSGDEPLRRADSRFQLLASDHRDLVLGHTSQNFDRLAVSIDLNVVFPIDRLHELAERGTIGSVAPWHASFVGNQTDATLETILLDSGPAAAQALLDAGAEVVLFTPV